MVQLYPFTHKCHILPGEPENMPGYDTLCWTVCNGQVLLLCIRRQPTTFIRRSNHRCRSYRVRVYGPKHLRPRRDLVAYTLVRPSMTWDDLQLLSSTYPLPEGYVGLRFPEHVLVNDPTNTPSEPDWEDHDLSRNVCKAFLKEKIAEIETEYHLFYALMMGLPKENCYIRRFYDAIRDLKGYGTEWEAANTFTLHEFLDRYDEFHPRDTFGICLAVHRDRIDTDEATMYHEYECLDRQVFFMVPVYKLLVENFLLLYCEKCQRENRPFELSAETIAHFGFTPADIRGLEYKIGIYNAQARAMIWAEYDALTGLDFIRASQR